MPEPQVVAEVVRSGFVEGWHHGSVLALNHDGSVLWALGDVESAMFPRSANKPMQAVAMLRCGLALDPALLALAAASHSAEDFHLEGVRRILAGAGLSEAALQTPPELPVEERVRDDALQRGVSPAPILMNCSGKHAAMLATCVTNGWDLDSYRDPAHPLQVAIRATVEDLTGVPVTAVGVDGCGAPLFSTTLRGLATAFRRISVASPESPEGRVAAAYRRHPEYASGTSRDETRLLRALPGAVAKGGAEGVYATGLPDGRAVALKILDGGARARPVVMAAALRRLGLEHPVLDEQATAPVLGGGTPVGAVRATL
ncbi:MAG: asparaginase [Actinomycetota bacterium]|nr:asparaginase [Actinomycetota bacterium]